MKCSNDTAAPCGLFCGTCPKYPEVCQGCLSKEPINLCDFRKCAIEHEVIRCYECVEFPCLRLKEFSTKHWVNGICHHKTIISDLQFMKENGVETWIDQKIEENLCPKCGKLIYWMDKNIHMCE